MGDARDVGKNFQKFMSKGPSCQFYSPAFTGTQGRPSARTVFLPPAISLLHHRVFPPLVMRGGVRASRQALPGEVFPCVTHFPLY